MSPRQLFFKTGEFKFLHKVNLFANTSFYILSKVSRVLNQKVVLIHNSDWSCIRVDIFHAFNIMDGDKISSLVIVRHSCGDFSSLCGGDFSDINFREILPWMIHLPLLTKVINNQPIEPHLRTIQHNSFSLFLCSYKLINTNNPSKIPDITKYDYIIF